MRKFLLGAVFALMCCSRAIATPTSEFEGFGLLKVFSTDHPVILRADGEPYYDNVHKFIAINQFFAARLRNKLTYYEMPYATLIDMASAMRYRLNPVDWYGDVYRYTIADGGAQGLEGKKVMWNVLTSPDVIVGSATIPAISSLSREIAPDEIVPYVRINHDTENYQNIGRVDLFFVKSGDWSTPVALGNSTVNVYLNRRTYSGSDYTTVVGSTGQWTFTNFDRPVRNSFMLNEYEGYIDNLTVEYQIGGSHYVWNFVPMFGQYSSIEWGKLELDKQPLTITAGQSTNIEIKLPARAEINADELEVSVGNSDLLSVSSLNFTQGSASWNGLTYSEQKSTLSFSLDGIAPGRTTLKLYLPEFGTYYREIHVVDSSGNMNITNSPSTNGLSLTVSSYTSRARFVNGKPYYPSAQSSSAGYVLMGSGSYPDNGYLGISNGSTYEVHPFSRTTGNNFEFGYNGVRFNTLDSSDNYERSSLNINPSNADSYNVWIEFPEDSSMNVVSAELSAIISGDYLTTQQQLANFAPYFEIKFNEDFNPVSLDWSFINPATGATVTPNISDILVNGQVVDGFSGTMPLGDYVYFIYHIYFSYNYNGTDYLWEFNPIDRNYRSSLASSYNVNAGSSRDIQLDIDNHSDIEAIDLLIGDEGILSADPVRFSPADTISFDITGIAQGNTMLALLYTLKDMPSFDKYVQDYADVRVTSGDTSATFVSGDLSLNVNFTTSPITEGIPDYEITDYSLRLIRSPDTVPEEYYDNNSGKFIGKIFLYSNDQEIASYDLRPDVLDPYDNNTYMLRYNIGPSYPLRADRLSWAFSDDVNMTGSVDIPHLNPPDLMPYLRLYRDGVNAKTLEWYFVDAYGNKLSDPSVKNFSLNVSTLSPLEFSSERISGSMDINVPDILISNFNVSFVSGDISYLWQFFPIYRRSFLYSYLQYKDDYVISWDIASPDLPLIMTVGDTKTLTLSAAALTNPRALIGNPSLVDLDTLSSTASSVTVKLTAKSAGMTSISLRDNSTLTWPREIWIADSNGKVPGLTSDIDALVDTIISEGNGGWFTYTVSDDTSGTDSPKTSPDTGAPEKVLDGLSVYPRYVVPTDPSPDAYNAAWNEIYSDNVNYGVYMFEQDVNVLASRDARLEFLTLSRDLIGRFPPQLLAIVLPEIAVPISGLYTFRIPVDHITLSNASLFMHLNPASGYLAGTYLPEHVHVKSNSSSDILTYTDDYSVTVSIDRNSAGEALLLITSKDIKLSDDVLAYTIDSTDAGGNISQLRIYGKVRREDLTSSDDLQVNISARTPEGMSSNFGWAIVCHDSQNMSFFDDYGQELTSLNGQKFINVSVYLEAGTTYAPYITVKATSNDIFLLTGEDSASTNFALRVSSTDVTVTAGSSVDVKLTPVNAVGNVVYAVSDSWITVNNNIATIAPHTRVTSGLHRVSITAADDDNHVATVFINVNVIGGAAPSNPSPEPSPTPVSPDNPAPVSPDNPAPVSPDNSAPEPEPEPTPEPTPEPEPEPLPVPGNNNIIPTSNDQSTTPNTTDDEDNSTSTENFPRSYRPTDTRLNLNDYDIVSRVLALLSSFFTGEVDVLPLPESAVGVDRSIDDITDAELGMIPANEIIVLIMPTIVVPETAIYVWGAEVPELAEGRKIFMHLMRRNRAASSVKASSDTDEPYVFLDDFGAQVDTVPFNQHVNIAAYLEPNGSYSPVLTTLREGSEEPVEDNTPVPLPTPQEQTDNDVGASSSGCNTGLPLMSVALLALLTKRRCNR